MKCFNRDFIGLFAAAPKEKSLRRNRNMGSIDDKDVSILFNFSSERVVARSAYERNPSQAAYNNNIKSN